MIYHNARPYIASDETTPFFTCSKSFGNPSSHASFSATFYLTVFLMLFHDKRKKVRNPNALISDDYQNVEEIQYQNKPVQVSGGLYALSLIFTILLILLISLSRVVLGAHS